jgi:hypothetical protein
VNVLEDATLAHRDEATAILRCLRESLFEPLFMRALALVVSGNGQEAEREDNATLRFWLVRRECEGRSVIETLVPVS